MRSVEKAMKNKALVLLSGGIDSTTALHWARDRFHEVRAVIFHYQQKHAIEVKMAEKIAGGLGIGYRIMDIPLKDFLASALTDPEREIPDSLKTAKGDDGIPHTYVPFRNGIFLSLAAGYGESRGIFDLVTGFNVVDSPDYPDTTRAFVQKMEAALNAGTSCAVTNQKFRIHAPLIEMTKADIINLGLQMGADYAHSLSCYRGKEVPCMACPACEIRSKAFRALGVADPLLARLKKEGRL